MFPGHKARVGEYFEAQSYVGTTKKKLYATFLYSPAQLIMQSFAVEG